VTLFVLDDAHLATLARAFGRTLAPRPPRAPGRAWGLATAVLVLMVLSVVPFLPFIHPLAGLNRELVPLRRVLGPWRSLNAYHLFASMTLVRREAVIEGSRDGVVWHAYSFRYKPGDPAQRPGWVAPHQPRLDWQMWFAALRTVQAESWFLSFAVRLLDGSPEVLALLAANPFPEAPPVFVRALIREYHFAPKGAGDWWTVGEPRLWMPVVQLRRRPAASQ